MNTISAFEKDIELQPEFIENFVSLKQLSMTRQKSGIICGTGDSFSSALLCEIFSNFKIKAFDPLDLLKNRMIAKGKELYLISISGNTSSNIKLAKSVKNTIAVTANANSRLGKACKKIINLRFRSSGIFTSGSISFLASTLTCISLVSRIKITNAHTLLAKAKKVSKGIHLKGKVFLLGNLHTFPIAMFAAAKLYEILGLDAHYERIEQFSHMGLFSANHGDTVIIFEEKNSYNSKLKANLKKCGLKVIIVEPPASSKLGNVIFFTFVVELIALYHAKKKKLEECFFVTAKNLRNASSEMIY